MRGFNPFSFRSSLAQAPIKIHAKPITIMCFSFIFYNLFILNLSSFFKKVIGFLYFRLVFYPLTPPQKLDFSTFQNVHSLPQRTENAALFSRRGLCIIRELPQSPRKKGDSE